MGGPHRTHSNRRRVPLDELWGCARSKTMGESVDAIGRVGFELTRPGPMQDMGTSRHAGSMFLLDDVTGLRPSELGEFLMTSPQAEWNRLSRPHVKGLTIKGDESVETVRGVGGVVDDRSMWRRSLAR